MPDHSQSLSGIALQKFKKNFWGVFSSLFIVLMLFFSLFAYLLAPDNSVNANQMHLSIHSKSPGFSVQMLIVPSDSEAVDKSGNYFSGFENTVTEIPITNLQVRNDDIQYKEFSDDPALAAEKSLALIKFPLAKSAESFKENYISKKTFLLGTDKYGRDLLSRMLVGSRISLSIGFVAVFISLIVGLFFGSIAGYYGGKIDAFVVWTINIVWSIPTLLLVIAITLALGKGFWQVFVAVGLTMWVEVARVVRGQIISVKQMQYVTAARALGFGDGRIIVSHILPNIMAPVIVICAANFASAILIESGLSFLGLGAQPPVPSWGSIIKDHYSYIILGKPYLAMVPGIAIMLLTLAFMMVGNALREALDVRV